MFSLFLKNTLLLYCHFLNYIIFVIFIKNFHWFQHPFQNFKISLSDKKIKEMSSRQMRQKMLSSLTGVEKNSTNDAIDEIEKSVTNESENSESIVRNPFELVSNEIHFLTFMVIFLLNLLNLFLIITFF
jgi:hypothetical protein